ncbi:DUF5801 repeats-in-toxin domain-containing protein, partial [Halomonas koreensis]
DGAGQTDIDYALQLAVAEGTASGLTSGGEAINLYINGDGTLVTGSTAADEGSVAAGNTIFTLSLNSTTGVLTQTQSGVIDHDQTDTYDGAYISDEKLLADGLVELVASAETTDSEGDTSGVNSETLDLGGNVRFGDDGPDISDLDDTTMLAFAAGASGGDLGFLEYGADGEGDFVITSASFNMASDSALGTVTATLAEDGKSWVLSSDLIVDGEEFGDFFKITVDGSGTGSYTAEVLKDAPLIEVALIEDTTTPGGPVEEVDLPEGNPIVTLDGFLFESQDTGNLRQTYLDGDLEEPEDADAELDDINISNKGAALFDNQFDAGEGLALNFNEGVAGARFIVQGGTGSPGSTLTIKMAAYDAEGNIVKDADGNEVREVSFTLPKGNASQEVVFEAAAGEEIHQLILIHDAEDNGFRIPEIFAFTYADIPDIEGTVNVETSDGDDDVATDSFDFSIDGDGDGVIDTPEEGALVG